MPTPVRISNIEAGRADTTFLLSFTAHDVTEARAAEVAGHAAKAFTAEAASSGWSWKPRSEEFGATGQFDVYLSLEGVKEGQATRALLFLKQCAKKLRTGTLR